METKEFEFRGSVMNGFLMLFVNLAVLILTIVGVVQSIIMLDATDGSQGGWLLGLCGLMIWHIRPNGFLLDQSLLWHQEG